MQAVSVFMDVEDPINPLADDAALDLARLFTDHGVRGCFCVTGAKCRTLVGRKRSDVLDALRPHDLGLHTNTHSVHPTTMELLADVAYIEGCKRALESESAGYASFVDAFDRPPGYWGGAGNTWSPEIDHALVELGIPALVYCLTSVRRGAVHRFNGTFHFPQNVSIGEAAWADDGLAITEGDRALSELASTNRPWSGLFVGHPTRMRHKEFWDKPYMAGRQPEEPEKVEPVPATEFERSKHNLGKFLDRLKGAVKIVGVDDALRLPWRFEALNQDELAAFRTATEANIRAAARWPVHRPGLDPSRIVEKALALAGTVEVGAA